MSKAFLYLTGASASGATTIFLLQRWRQEAAAEALIRDAELEVAVQLSHIKLAVRHAEARAAGVEPDLVAQSYRNKQDRLLPASQVAAWLLRNS